MVEKRRFIEWEMLPKLTFEEPNKLLAALYGEGEDFLFEVYNSPAEEPDAEAAENIPASYPQNQFTVRLFKDKTPRVFAVLRLPDTLQEGDCAFIGIRFGKEENEAPLFRMVTSALGGGFSLCGLDAGLVKKELALAPVRPEKQIETLVASLEPVM